MPDFEEAVRRGNVRDMTVSFLAVFGRRLSPSRYGQRCCRPSRRDLVHTSSRLTQRLRYFKHGVGICFRGRKSMTEDTLACSNICPFICDRRCGTFLSLACRRASISRSVDGFHPVGRLAYFPFFITTPSPVVLSANMKRTPPSFSRLSRIALSTSSLRGLSV